MPHLNEPGKDNGFFSTEEVRDPNQEWSQDFQKTSRAIALPKNHYKSPPAIALGINGIECDSSQDIRVAASAERVSASRFDVMLQTWNNSKLYSGRAQWLEAASNARECQVGTWEAQGQQQQNSTQIKFDRPYNEAPEVIVWLRTIDLERNSSDRQPYWRLVAYSSDMSASEFTLHIDTWNVSKMRACGVTWIAFPKNKKHVTSGHFENYELGDSLQRQEQRISFPEGKFTRGPPRILTGLNAIDHTAEKRLIVRSNVKNVSEKGFTWSLHCPEAYGANASYIALGM